MSKCGSSAVWKIIALILRFSNKFCPLESIHLRSNLLDESVLVLPLRLPLYQGKTPNPNLTPGSLPILVPVLSLPQSWLITLKKWETPVSISISSHSMSFNHHYSLVARPGLRIQGLGVRLPPGAPISLSLRNHQEHFWLLRLSGLEHSVKKGSGVKWVGPIEPLLCWEASLLIGEEWPAKFFLEKVCKKERQE